MHIFSDSFQDGEFIPGGFAFAIPDNDNHITLSSNLNPELHWGNIPAATQSFALICHDPDVPVDKRDVNTEGKSLSASAPRETFIHWGLFDIPVSVMEIAAGSQSGGIIPRGKPGPQAPDGYKHAINDYTAWFNADENMQGQYYGYDGPCPPWNDELTHRYIFTLYALPVQKLDIVSPFTGNNLRDALAKAGVLAEAKITGLYSLNSAQK